MNEAQINSLFTEQSRKRSLVTPQTFQMAIGTSSTTLYTGRENEFFLIRKVVFSNTGVGNVNLTLALNGVNIIPSKSISSNATLDETALAGHLLAPDDDIKATGSATGLNVFGWGIRVSGGDGWTL